MAYIVSTVGGLLMGSFLGFVAPKRIRPYNKQCTVAIQAQITDYVRVLEELEPIDTNDGSIHVYRYHPIYTYEYQGQIYTSKARQSLVFRPRIGRKRRIMIDPNNPSSFAYATNTVMLFRVLGILLIVVSIVSLLRSL